METKEMKIVPPEGYEIDRENSTFECIKFKPIKKTLTYEDVAKELFCDQWGYYLMGDGCIGNSFTRYSFPNFNNCTSKEQAEKLLAINNLMNVAKYLNGYWKPNWDANKKIKFYIYINEYNEVTISSTFHYNVSVVYFKSKEDAQQAIDILGEETIRLALSTDW